jgi:hypothetical protein
MVVFIKKLYRPKALGPKIREGEPVAQIERTFGSSREPKMRTLAFVFAIGLAALTLFQAGYATGQSRFGQPKTVIHVVSVKWKADVSDEDKQKILDGVKKMAGSISGVRNVWIKSERVEPRGFDNAFVIEFQNSAAADAYASSPFHKAWNDFYSPLRTASVSIDVTNP